MYVNVRRWVLIWATKNVLYNISVGKIRDMYPKEEHETYVGFQLLSENSAKDVITHV